MLYQAYQTTTNFFAPWRRAADLAVFTLQKPMAMPLGNLFLRSFSAGAEALARSRLIHERPEFGLRDIAVDETVADSTPFGTLLHFHKHDAGPQPRVLIVAPMAGHFVTLLRDTVRTMLPDHDVFVTDWKNARDVPRGAGRFGLDEYIDHIVRFLGKMGDGAHVLGVCQPCNALLAAVAVMAQTGNPAVPRSMTLMAGPVDTRINPTQVNRLANAHPIDWFERNLIATVPRQFKGAHRRVYPGFIQLSAFLSMNVSRHMRAHLDLMEHIVRGEADNAEAVRDFYDEYFAVLDLPAEFYLETVERVFQEHQLARGVFEWQGRRIEPGAIERTSLLTVEGERDDICAPGQTFAAHTLCAGIDTDRKAHHLQPGVGHYGVFAGKRWQTQIYPIVREHIRESD
jgi:polyhydroxyalkanoate depolymerase